MRHLSSLALVLVALPAPIFAQTSVNRDWAIHATDRPQPRVVRPGPVASAAPPSDAIVLFDGKSLDGWRAGDDSTRPARWLVKDGYMEVVPRTGGIATRRGFGDVQLHVEWATPAIARDSGQNRGNSGVFLMERYEIQVLDSYGNLTYPDGQASAVYGQHPPLVNASRGPGEWQTYDIVFRRPRFDAGGKLVTPARVTVLHNGVLVHDAAELTGPSGHHARPPYVQHPDRLPISLQDHGAPVRFRNIWLRELPESSR